MRILILGGGGREHAIGWKLKKDDPATELISAPGNPGLASLGRCLSINPSDPGAVVTAVTALSPDLVVVGPEAPLAAGVSDACRAAGFRVFGPSQKAAQLESSKRFAKELMLSIGVPTAKASTHSDPTSAKSAARSMGAPVVIKASGLAAGKGVVVALSIQEAEHAIDDMLTGGAFGAAGAEVLVEEFMEGEEVSIFAITDGENFVLLPTAQDHKRLLDGDQGPNTGGMGAYSPASIASPAVLDDVCERIIKPTLAAMRSRGAPFSGLLYVGAMITTAGPKVVEFNCRFGDPETEVVLPIMTEQLLPLLLGASAPGGLSGRGTSVASNGYAVCTVVAAPGYPATPVTGSPLTPPPDSEHVISFHAGTVMREGCLVSSGGRVLVLTGVGRSIGEAKQHSLSAARSTTLSGCHFRSDVAWRELARIARASGN